MPIVTFDHLEVPKSKVVTFDHLIPKVDAATAGQKAVDDMTNNMSLGDQILAGAGRAFSNIGDGAKQILDVPAQYLESKFNPPTLSGLITGNNKPNSFVDKIGNYLGMPTAAQSAQATQAGIDSARIADEPLINTAGGAAGNITGNILASIPAAMVAGPSLLGATALGSGMAALEPTSGDESRLKNAAIGGALGFATQGVINKSGDYIRSKMADMAAKKLQNAPIDATIKNAVDAGMTIPRSNISPSFLTNRIEGIAGKTAMEQEASNANSSVFDAMSRRAVGLDADAALTSQNMQAVRNEAYQHGYEPVAKLGLVATDAEYSKALSDIVAAQQGAARSFPGAFSDDVMNAVKPLDVRYFDSGDALKASRLLRENGNKAYTAGDTALGKAQKDAAKAIEDQIERHLDSVGPQGGTDLLANFRSARELIAKAHTVEDAIVEGGGSVNPAKFAQRIQSGEPMSGDLKTMGDFANNFPKLSRPDNKVRGAGVSKLDGALSAGLGTAATAFLGPVGGLAVAGASLATPPLLRKILLSKTMQNSAATRNYDPSMLQQVLTSKELQMGAVPIANALRDYMSSR